MTNLYIHGLRRSATYAVGSAGQHALLVLLLPLYTHYLSLEDYGALALVRVTVSLLIPAVAGPLASALNRFYYKPEYEARQGDLVGGLLVLLAAKTAVLVGAYWALARPLTALLFDDPARLTLVRLFVGVLVFQPLATFGLALVQLKGMARYHVAASVAGLLTSCAVTVYLLVWRTAGPAGVATGLAVQWAATFLVCLPVLLASARWRLSTGVIGEPLRYGYPLIVSGCANTLLQSGDRYVLRAFAPVETVGLYDLGYQVASILSVLIVQPLKLGLSPIVLQMEQEPDTQKRFLRVTATYYYAGALAAGLALALFAPEVVRLLARKEAYWAAAPVVPWIVFAYVQHGLGNFLGWGLVMKREAYHISGLLVGTAALNLGLNVFLIPMWGILGAALATVLAYLAWNALKAYYSARMYGLRFDLRALVGATVVWAVLCAAGWTLLPTEPAWLSATSRAACLAAYPAALWLTGLLPWAGAWQVLETVRAAFHPTAGGEPSPSPRNGTDEE